MQRAATFSDCGRYRYVLWRWWDAAQPYCLFVGLNPSTADAERDDPTIRRCVRFAADWGFGGVCVANLFAYRATRPRDLLAAAEPVGPDNDAWLERLSREAALLVAAWGNHGSHLGRDRAVTALIARGMVCFGRTQQGQPRHPLYLRADSELVAF